jgi:UDP-glucose 4-epimerase
MAESVQLPVKYIRNTAVNTLNLLETIKNQKFILVRTPQKLNMMKKSRTKAAHAVILPAFDTTTLSDSVKRFL